MTRPRVVLCGPMGSGKTAVGRRLAVGLGVRLMDSDAEVESATGRAIHEIFSHDGEAAFRELERDAVARALTRHDGVLALGGGAVLHPDTRAALADYRAHGGIVVLLDVSPHYAHLRIGADRHRPLLHAEGESPRERWTRILAERRGVYEEVASHVVSTDRRTPGAVAREVRALLEPTEPTL